MSQASNAKRKKQMKKARAQEIESRLGKAIEPASDEAAPNPVSRRKVLGMMASAAVLTGCRGLEMGGGPVGGGGGTASGLKNLNHIIYMFQENRTFDHYFARLNDYRAAQGLPRDVALAPLDATNPSFDGTTTYQRFKYNTMCFENVSPAWNETHVQINRAYETTQASQVTTSPMDGFVYTGAKYARDQVPQFNETEGRRSMGYYDEAALPYYYWLATQFATCDRWFSPVPANSPANRLFSFAATSEGHVYAPTRTLSSKTIFHQLQEKGVTWKVYVTEFNVGPEPFTYLNYFQPFATTYKANIVPATQFATDCANGTLPAVAFIEAGYTASGLDEHPGNNVQVGAAYVASLINALMNSSAWKSSAFILSWDEGGGLYDHVAPPAAVSPDGIAPVDLASTDIRGDFDRYGLRVPFMLASPFARKGFVSHTTYDHTAILKLIQQRYELPSLTKRDAAQASMLEFFNWSAPNLTFGAPPAQPTNGACYYHTVP